MRKLFITTLLLSLANLPAAAQTLPGLPPGPLGAAIQSGHDMIMQTGTNAASKAYIGNALSCANCHTNAGNNDHPGNFLNTASEYPSFSPREGAVITLEDRIANCFMRSMNGKRPSTDSAVVVDMAAYIDWLDRDKKVEALPTPAASPYPAMVKAATAADYAAGQTLYKQNCAACHGANGAGMGSFPPVWGARSYNAGAGLANIAKLATWVKGNMPLGNPHLSDQEAFQVALYVDTQPRPDFVLRDHLPPGQAYNANVHSETDSVASNLKKAGLSAAALQNTKAP